VRKPKKKKDSRGDLSLKKRFLSVSGGMAAADGGVRRRGGEYSIKGAV